MEEATFAGVSQNAAANSVVNLLGHCGTAFTLTDLETDKPCSEPFVGGILHFNRASAPQVFSSTGTATNFALDSVKCFTPFDDFIAYDVPPKCSRVPVPFYVWPFKPEAEPLLKEHARVSFFGFMRFTQKELQKYYALLSPRTLLEKNLMSFNPQTIDVTKLANGARRLFISTGRFLGMDARAAPREDADQPPAKRQRIETPHILPAQQLRVLTNAWETPSTSGSCGVLVLPDALYAWLRSHNYLCYQDGPIMGAEPPRSFEPDAKVKVLPCMLVKGGRASEETNIAVTLGFDVFAQLKEKLESPPTPFMSCDFSTIGGRDTNDQTEILLQQRMAEWKHSKVTYEVKTPTTVTDLCREVLASGVENYAEEDVVLGPVDLLFHSSLAVTFPEAYSRVCAVVANQLQPCSEGVVLLCFRDPFRDYIPKSIRPFKLLWGPILVANVTYDRGL